MSSTAAIAAIHLDGTMRPFKEEWLDGVKYVDRAHQQEVRGRLGAQVADPFP